MYNDCEYLNINHNFTFNCQYAIFEKHRSMIKSKNMNK